MIRRELRLEHGERGVEGVGARAHEAAQRGRYGGGEALEEGRGQGGGDVEAGGQTLQTLEAGGEAETSAGGETRQTRGAAHQRGQAGGLLARLGLGVELHQPRNVRPLK